MSYSLLCIQRIGTFLKLSKSAKEKYTLKIDDLSVGTFLEKLTKDNDKKKNHDNNRDTVAAETIITDLAMHTCDNTNNIFADIISLFFFLSFFSSSRNQTETQYAEEMYENNRLTDLLAKFKLQFIHVTKKNAI